MLFGFFKRLFGRSRQKVIKLEHPNLILSSRYEAADTIVGMFDQDGEATVSLKPNVMRDNNIIVLGNNEEFRSSFFTYSYILTCAMSKRSLIITDTDDAMYKKTKGYLEEAGYCVKHLNFQDPFNTDSFDLLGANADITGERHAGRILRYVLGEIEDKDLQRAMITLLAGIIHEHISRYPDPQPVTREVFESLGSISEWLMNQTVKSFRQYVERDVFPASIADDLFEAFDSFNPNIQASALYGLGKALKDFSLDNVSKVIAGHDSFTDIINEDEPFAVFISYREHSPGYKKLVPLIVDTLYELDVLHVDENSDNSCRNMSFVISDVAMIGQIHELDRKLAVASPRGMSFVLGGESTLAFEKAYSRTYPGIFSSCSTVLVLTIQGATSIKGLTGFLDLSLNISLMPNQLCVLTKMADPLVLNHFPYGLHPQAERLG